MTTLAPDKTDEKTAGEKTGTLKTAGIAYLVGDAAIIGAGLFDSSKKTWTAKGQHALVGAYWALGGAAAARYGNPKAEKQIEILSRRLGEYLKKQGIEIPKSPNTADLIKQGGVIDHLEDFLYKYPSEVLNAVYALGAVQLAWSGSSQVKDAKGILAKGGLGADALKATKYSKTLGRFDMASGILIGAGALAGLLIPEKKPDPEHPAEGMFDKLKEWAQEKPLRVSGLLYHANNLAMIGAAYSKYKANPESKNYWWRAVTAASYIFANTMLALSSKGNVSGDKDNITPQLANVSAAVIAAQPQEIQEALVQNIAGYLSAQPEIKKTAPEIAELLHAKLAETKQVLPAAGKWQQHLETGLNPQISPSL